MKKFLVAFLVTLATCSMVFCVGPRTVSAEMISSQPAERGQDDVRDEMRRSIAYSLLRQSGIPDAAAIAWAGALTPGELETLAGSPELSQNAGTTPITGVIGAVLLFIALLWILWIESNTLDDPTGPPQRHPAK